MVRVWRKFSHLFEKKQKSRIIILFLMMIFGAFLETIGVSLMIPFVSAITQPNIINKNVYIAQVCKHLGIYSNKIFIIMCIVSLIIVYIIKDLYLLFEYYVQYRFIYNNRLATQVKMLHSYMKRPYTFYLKIQSGEIIRVVQTDVQSTFLLLTTMLTFFTEMIVMIVLVFTIFIINPLITVFTAVMMGITLLVIAKVIKPILKKEGMSYQKHGTKTYQWLTQTITGIKEIKVTNKESFFEQNYSASGMKMIRAEKKKAVDAELASIRGSKYVQKLKKKQKGW